MVADAICKALDRNGITYFIDRKGICGGAEFPAVLADAIIDSELVLFLASRNSYESRFTNKEITFAFNEKPGNSIIPYIIDGSQLPRNLRLVFADINWRTITEHPIDTVLMDDLRTILHIDAKPANAAPAKVDYGILPSGYFITDSCIGCGTCQAECPVEAISEGEIYSIDCDTCIECGSCEMVCPAEAIIRR